MNAAHARGAVTTRDRARHMIAAQLEADFCLPHGSVAKAHGQGAERLVVPKYRRCGGGMSPSYPLAAAAARVALPPVREP